MHSCSQRVCKAALLHGGLFPGPTTHEGRTVQPIFTPHEQGQVVRDSSGRRHAGCFSGWRCTASKSNGKPFTPRRESLQHTAHNCTRKVLPTGHYSNHPSVYRPPPRRPSAPQAHTLTMARAVLSVMLAAAAAFASAASRGDGVYTLTPDNFEDLVGSGTPALVEFYAPVRVERARRVAQPPASTANMRPPSPYASGVDTARPSSPSTPVWVTCTRRGACGWVVAGRLPRPLALPRFPQRWRVGGQDGRRRTRRLCLQVRRDWLPHTEVVQRDAGGSR